MLAVAEVAGVGVLHDQIHQLLAPLRHTRGFADVVGQLPGGGFVDPHQRGVDEKAVVHAQRERDLQRLHGVVAAIGVAGEVGFADAGDDDLDAAPVGQRGRKGEEQQVAPGHEGVGQAAGLHLKRGLAGERGVADLPEHGEVEQVVFAESLAPGGEAFAQFGQHRDACLQFHVVSLAVVEAQRFHSRVARERLGQAGGGILAA